MIDTLTGTTLTVYVSAEPESAHAVIVPEGATKDTKHRLTKFATYLDQFGYPWHAPDLAAYRDHLLESLSPVSVLAHLSSIRSRYRDLMRDRDLFYSLIEAGTDDPVLRKAMVDEITTRLSHAIDPEAAPVKVTKIQDREDQPGQRLTQAQAQALMAGPDTGTLIGLRDTALIVLALCTGLREAELAALDVDDLRARVDGRLACKVAHGKGNKQRLVLYGDLAWSLQIVDQWLTRAGIDHGPVFRGLYKGGRVRASRLSTRQIQSIVSSYPVLIEGNPVTVRPHDLRRTYARLLYDGGMDLVGIQQQLGHSNIKTTLRYIGLLDAAQRSPPAVLLPPGT